MKMVFCFLIMFLFTAMSCAPSRTMVNTSCSGYLNVNFHRSLILLKGIGIMPVLGGDEKEQYRRPMGDEITKYFRLEFGDEQIKSPGQVIDLLNDAGLVDEYIQAISDYSISGIVPKDMVIQLGQKMKVGYLLYTRLLADSEIGVVNDGYSSQVICVDELYVQCQVWDTRRGDVAWEGKGGISKLDTDPNNMLQKTAEGLVKVVGKEMNSGPCENPDELIKAVQKAKTNTYWAVSGISLGLFFLLLLI